MTKKELFIDYVTKLMNEDKEAQRFWIYYSDEQMEQIESYFNALKVESSRKKKEGFTDNGKLILKHLQERSADVVGDASFISTAKEIANEIGISSRSVSGSMRSLVAEGYVEKVGKDPVVYELTNKGKEAIID